MSTRLNMKEMFYKENIDALPKIGVYFLFNENEIVYIGQSINILNRVGTHTQSKTFNSWNYISCSREELNDLEAELIIQHKPVLNSSLPKNKMWISINQIKNTHDIGKLALKKAQKQGYFSRQEFFGDIYFLVDEVEALKEDLL